MACLPFVSLRMIPGMSILAANPEFAQVRVRGLQTNCGMRGVGFIIERASFPLPDLLFSPLHGNEKRASNNIRAQLRFLMDSLLYEIVE